MNMRFTARGSLCAVVLLMLAWGIPAFAADPYSLGDLSLQNGWDSGIAGQGFTNNDANSNVVTNADARTGTQSWRYSGSYGSPGSGTPFTPYVATVGAPNAATVFGPGLNSPVTPAGDQSVIAFAFRAIAPGDGSQFNVYEGNRDLPDPARTGTNIYVQATSATDVTIYRFQLSSSDSCANQDFPQVVIATVAAGTWHTVKMTTTYPAVTPANLSTFGTTTYVVNEGAPGEVTVTDPDAAWVHPYSFCNAGAYSPGTSVKWSNSFNDYPTHMGFYIDDVSMKVNDTGTSATVASFATSFEAAALSQAALTVNVTSPATIGTTQTLTTTGGSGEGAVSYSVGSSTACTVVGDQLTFTSGTGTCDVTATKAADDIYDPTTSSPATVIVQPANPTLTTQASAGITLGGNVNDDATLALGSAPTGSITFNLYGPNDATCTGAVAFTANIPVAGNATYNSGNFTPTLAGLYRWVASYSGDSNNGPATSPCNAPNESVVVTVPAGATMSGTKTAAPGTYTVGSNVTYTVTLTNSGAGAQGDNPGNEFIDVLPPQLQLVSASATSPTVVATVGTNTVTWNGTIPPAGTVTITIIATILPSAAGTTVTNQGTINFDTDGNGTNESTTQTDDPAVGGAGDPTGIAVAAAAATPGIPAVSPIGLLLLCAALAGVAMMKFTRMA